MSENQCIQFGWDLEEQTLIGQFLAQSVTQLIHFLNYFSFCVFIPLVESQFFHDSPTFSPVLNVVQWERINRSISLVSDLVPDLVVDPTYVLLEISWGFLE